MRRQEAHANQTFSLSRTMPRSRSSAISPGYDKEITTMYRNHAMIALVAGALLTATVPTTAPAGFLNGVAKMGGKKPSPFGGAIDRIGGKRPSPPKADWGAIFGRMNAASAAAQAGGVAKAMSTLRVPCLTPSRC
jgi:hypothetical protein